VVTKLALACKGHTIHELTVKISLALQLYKKSTLSMTVSVAIGIWEDGFFSWISVDFEALKLVSGCNLT
jgi:hypothetical protein